jgi:hypothetical protein
LRVRSCVPAKSGPSPPVRPGHDSTPVGRCQGLDNIWKFVNCTDSRRKAVKALTGPGKGYVILPIDNPGYADEHLPPAVQVSDTMLTIV